MVRAIPFHELGGPEVLRYEELPVREPGPGEVLSLGPDVADWAPGDAVSVVPSFSPNDFPVTPRRPWSRPRLWSRGHPLSVPVVTTPAPEVEQLVAA